MRLSMMAMAANRLGEALVPEVKLQLVYVIREMDGGAGQPEESGTIVRIPSIAALEPFYRN